MTIKEWVKDGLMAQFFYVIGLELKREMTVGELSDPRTVALPVEAAFGGAAGSLASLILSCVVFAFARRRNAQAIG